MNDTIIPPTDSHPQESIHPSIRYHRITPVILHTGHWLHIADGVIEVDGQAYLGQMTGAGPAFRVAGFLAGAQYAYRAPLGWQADIVASSTLNGEGGGPPPPSWVAAFRRPARLPLEVAA